MAKKAKNYGNYMMGDTHVLRVTSATGRNPVKTANMIHERDDVAYCSPQLMVEQQRHQNSFADASVLFRDQWYLTIFDPGFVDEISEMTRTGGRRGNGLVIVFSAGNDDAPTRLSAAQNVNGVRFLGRNAQGQFVVREIPRNKQVFSAYPSIPGTVVVAAMSSMTRKSGYSNWGPDITVTAPSSNGHELGSLPDFQANYRGLGQIGATNRPGHGAASRPLNDDPTTPNVREDFYTDDFGGTSGAAPVVAGIAGLMLSANPHLTAAEVRGILMATADRDLDTAPDLPSDPNLQGITGEFVNGRSQYFGSGKANALKAVSRAKALMPPSTGQRKGTAVANLDIPDNNRQGIVSTIDLSGAGPVQRIRVDVDITHTYRGDLSVTLISPAGFTAILHRVFQGGGADDLRTTYTMENNSDLADIASGSVEGGGSWRLHVADRLNRDTGKLNTWSIDLT